MPPPPGPRWEIAPEPPRDVVRALQAALSLPEPLCALLAIRGMPGVAEAKSFLRPSLDTLHPPGLLTDLPEAVLRIESAIRNRETIFVHGDYDVDGMTGTALLTRCLRELGGEVVPFVPHRLRHGYDLGPAGLSAAAEAGASLLVTVDCGILAHEAVAEAGHLGMDVVVTDHHTPGETLPAAIAVLNPNRPDSRYPEGALCGAGVAFKLCQGLAGAFDRREDELHTYLDLVAMATIADLVPLVGENRTLVRFGLRVLAQTCNPGLRALMETAGVDGGEISAGAVGFVLAPRLNAVGRLGDPATALRLLLSDDQEETRVLAAEAEALNRERQAADRETLEQALAILARDFDPERDFGVVLAGEGWHPGVVGIVASRVVEAIHRPTVMVALDGDRGRGSARSIPGFHLLEAIRTAGEHLERFGGHRQAAGMDVLRDRLPDFSRAFAEEASRVLSGQDLRPVLRVDLEVGLAEMTDELHRFMKYMGPHGIGNPRPVFLARGVELAGPGRVVGKDHLKVRLRENGVILEGIGFGLAGRVPPATLGRGPVDVVFQLHENEFRGVRQLQARMKDIRPTGEPGP